MLPLNTPGEPLGFLPNLKKQASCMQQLTRAAQVPSIWKQYMRNSPCHRELRDVDFSGFTCTLGALLLLSFYFLSTHLLRESGNLADILFNAKYTHRAITNCTPAQQARVALNAPHSPALWYGARDTCPTKNRWHTVY